MTKFLKNFSLESRRCKMKIFVIGAGATGSVLINTLAQSEEVSSVHCLSNNKKMAEESVNLSRKIKIFYGNAGDSRKLERLAKESNLVVNAASPLLNMKILRLALKLNAHYQDLSAHLGFDDGRSKQPYAIEHLSLEREFKKKKLVALFDAGAAPGLTNLLVAEASDKFGIIHSVTIRMVEEINSSVAFSTWSPATAADEICSRPVVYRNGRFILLGRYSDPEDFNFPEPFGRKTTYSIMNNESFTVPHYLKIKNMEVRSAGSSDEVARLIIGLGLLNKKPVRINGVNITPLDFINKIMPLPPTPKELRSLMEKGLIKDGNLAVSIEALPIKRSLKKHRAWVAFPSQKELFQRSIYYSFMGYAAGICAAAFALEILNIGRWGILPPEGLPKENRDNILKRMMRLGVKIK